MVVIIAEKRCEKGDRMVVFAICLVIVFIMLVSLGRDRFSNVISKGYERQYAKMREAFQAKVTPTELQLQEAMSNKDYSDVIGDLSEIMNQEVTTRMVERNLEYSTKLVKSQVFL